jgi:small subunit ribosomal protein S2
MTENEFLVSKDQYLNAGIHVGSKFKTDDMSSFIYKTRPDGLSVLDVKQIDERIRLTANLLANYEPEDVLIACRRESGRKAVKQFADITGAQFYEGRYPPGVLTNPELDDFVEAKVLVVIDPVPDKNAIKDAKIVGIPIVGLCDTNNDATNLDLVLPCNNKGRKSLGLVFYLLAKLYAEERDIIPSDEWDYEVDDFIPTITI